MLHLQVRKQDVSTVHTDVCMLYAALAAIAHGPYRRALPSFCWFLANSRWSSVSLVWRGVGGHRKCQINSGVMR